MSAPIKQFEKTDHAVLYSRYRPTYTGCGLVETVLEYLWGSKEKRRLGLAVDVGCGQGQIIPQLADHFDGILGIDVSNSQIEQARLDNILPHVTFSVASAEKIPVEDNSIDLITVNEALHWLDHAHFYEEVDRVLKPGGVIAATMYSYDTMVVNHSKQTQLSDIVNKIMNELIDGGYFHERVKLITGKYRDPRMQIPYKDSVRNESLAINIESTIGHMFKYLESTSGVYNFLMSDQNQEVWENTMTRFCEVYGSGNMESKLTYRLDIVLLMGRKPK